MEVKLSDHLGSYDRQTNRPIDRPTDTGNQTGSKGSFTSNNLLVGEVNVPEGDGQREAQVADVDGHLEPGPRVHVSGQLHLQTGSRETRNL